MSAIRFAITRWSSTVEDAWPVTRRGWLIQVNGGASVGYGEASPMPNYAADTLRACGDALTRATNDAAWAEAILQMDLDAIAALAQQLSAHSPAAACGMEMAALDHIGRRRNESVANVLSRYRGDATPQRVAVNSVIPPVATELAMAHAVNAYDAGIRCFKLKVGRDHDRELSVARALRAAYGDDVELRIDANGGWSVAEAPALLADFASVAPAFCEQPTPPGTLRTLPHLAVPFAADESCGHAELDALLADPPAQMMAVVLKPMALGGALRCMVRAQQAHAAGLDVVVTHFLDGPLGVAYAAELAAVLPAKVRTSGLARHPGLRAWTQSIPQLGTADAGTADAPGLGIVIDRAPK